MKIGLILSHKGINYGMLLQAYATQMYLESQGVQTEIITFQSSGGLKRKLKKLKRYTSFVAAKSAYMKAKRRWLINNNPILKRCYQARSKVGIEFVQKNLHGIVRFAGNEIAANYVKENYSCVMIGSDQQWAPACFYSELNTLMFVPEGVKRASYATSMGVSSIPKNTHSLLKTFISKMDYVSVREETGKTIITKVTGRQDVQVVPDPTFLITYDEWCDYIPKKKLYDLPYVFCYFLGSDDSSVKKVLAWTKQVGITAIFVRNVESYKIKKVDYEDAIVVDAPTVEEFVNYIRYASFVCTDSFHCTVFSLINSVEFATFYRFQSKNKDSRNSRIDDLLKSLDCSQRICRQEDDLGDVVNKKIDYDKVTNRIESMRMIGKDYLEEIIND